LQLPATVSPSIARFTADGDATIALWLKDGTSINTWLVFLLLTRTVAWNSVPWQRWVGDGMIVATCNAKRCGGCSLAPAAAALHLLANEANICNLKRR
jgi:hypothetical protein